MSHAASEQLENENRAKTQDEPAKDEGVGKSHKNATTTSQHNKSTFRYRFFVHPHFVVVPSSSPLARNSFRRCSLATACKLDEASEKPANPRRTKNNGGRRRTLHNNVIINEFPLWERTKNAKMVGGARHLPEILRMARSMGSSRSMLSGWCWDHSFSSSVSSRSMSEFFGVSSLICLLSSSFTLFIFLLDNISFLFFRLENFDTD